MPKINPRRSSDPRNPDVAPASPPPTSFSPPPELAQDERIWALKLLAEQWGPRNGAAAADNASASAVTRILTATLHAFVEWPARDLGELEACAKRILSRQRRDVPEVRLPVRPRHPMGCLIVPPVEPGTVTVRTGDPVAAGAKRDPAGRIAARAEVEADLATALRAGATARAVGAFLLTGRTGPLGSGRRVVVLVPPLLRLSPFLKEHGVDYKAADRQRVVEIVDKAIRDKRIDELGNGAITELASSVLRRVLTGLVGQQKKEAVRALFDVDRKREETTIKRGGKAR